MKINIYGISVLIDIQKTIENEMQNEYDEIEIDVQTLIDTILEFILMTPNRLDWNMDTLNAPRSIRAQQILVLCEQYCKKCYYPNDLRSTLDGILTGQFIPINPVEIYEPVYSRMESLIRSTKPKFQNINRWNNRILQYNYEQAFKYLIQLNQLMRFNDGQLVLGVEMSYAYLMTQQVNSSINSDQLIEFIGAVLDPSETIFPKQLLVDEYGYPNNLDDVDMKYL